MNVNVSSLLPHKRRSRTNSIPYSISFFLFITFLLAINYAFSSFFTNPQPLSIDQQQSIPLVHIAFPHLSNDSSIPTTFSSITSRSTASDYGNLCTDNIFESYLSLLFLIPIIIFCFIGLAIVTDDYFVAALEQICTRLKLSEDVAGATFMAAGSSTPEFFSSMIGTFITKDAVGLGTIVGSAVFNILIIIGLSSALAGSVLQLDWRPLIRDSTFYVISIILLFLFTYVISNGEIKWWEGLILVSFYGIYVLFMAFGNKPYMKAAAKLRWFGIYPEDEQQQNNMELGENNIQSLPINEQPNIIRETSIQPQIDQPSPRRTTSITPRTTVLEDGTTRYRDLHIRTRLRAAQISVIAIQRMQNDMQRRQRSSTEDSSPRARNDTNASMDRQKKERNETNSGSNSNSTVNNETIEEEKDRQFLGVELPSSIIGWIFFPFTFIWKLAYKYTIIDCSKEKYAKYWWVTFITAIIWISGVSYGMVELTRICGCILNIPATAMGLTVLAAGTSIPDALASISVARDGAGDMAVSNAIGSNVFDILLGLGVPWFLGDLILSGSNGKGPITVDTEPVTLVVVPIIILFTIMIVFLGILIALKWTMKPLLGYLLCGLYVVFVAYTLLDVYVFKIGQ